MADKRKHESDEKKKCEAVICEDPATGKITVRFGECNPRERRRLVRKIQQGGGIHVKAADLADPEEEEDE